MFRRIVQVRTQEFKEPLDEDGRETLDGEREQVLENQEREKIVVSNHEEDMGSIEKNQSSICV